MGGEGEEGGGAGGATDQPGAGSFTVAPSSRAPVIPYFFGFHSRASFWASDIWAGDTLLAILSRFLGALSRSAPGKWSGRGESNPRLKLGKLSFYR